MSLGGIAASCVRCARSALRRVPGRRLLRAPVQAGLLGDHAGADEQSQRRQPGREGHPAGRRSEHPQGPPAAAEAAAIEADHDPESLHRSAVRVQTRSRRMPGRLEHRFRQGGDAAADARRSKGPPTWSPTAVAAFPDVVFLLQGEGVHIELVGHTDIKKGITYSRFETVPDAPISSFEASLPEGPHSALGAFGDLCAEPLTAPTTIVAQNGRRLQTEHEDRGQRDARNRRSRSPARRSRGTACWSLSRSTSHSGTLVLERHGASRRCGKRSPPGTTRSRPATCSSCGRARAQAPAAGLD